MNIIPWFLFLVASVLLAFVSLYFLNPQTVTISYHYGELVTSPAIMVTACFLIGLLTGMLIYIVHTVNHQFRHIRINRHEKKAREVGKIYQEGVNRLLSGDLKKAREILTKALDRDASREEIHIALADVELQAGDVQQAITMLLKARQLNPRSLEVLFKMAAIYTGAGRNADAEKSYLDILEVEGNNRKALRQLRDLKVGQEEWIEAEKLQKKVLKVIQGSPRFAEEESLDIHIRYEIARDMLEEDKIDQAKAALKDIIKKESVFIPAQVSLGDAYLQQGRLEDAVHVWTNSYRSLKKGVFLERMEEAYMGAEDPSSLLSFYRSAVVDFPDDMMLRLFFGKVCVRLEMVDEALDQLQAVEGSGVTTSALHALLGECYRRRNNIDGAIAEYKLALGIDKDPSFKYVCQGCGHESGQWLSRCGTCSVWGEYALTDRQQLAEARMLELRPIHHGER